MCDIPQLVDEFMTVWHMNYDKRMRRFWVLRPLVERLFINYRFVKFSEFQEIFKNAHTQGLQRSTSVIDDLNIRYPVYRLAGIKSEKARQQFILNYKANDHKSYFAFMLKKNRALYSIFHTWHEVAIAKEHRIHSWITGTPGSGKSELMKAMILQDITHNLKKDCSIVVIDPNGDFTKEVAQFKELRDPTVRKKVKYIDLDLFKGEYTPVINPFQLQENAHKDREIDLTNQQIAKALEEICNAFGQPLTSQMQTILYNCTSVLLEKKNSSLWDLQTMVLPVKNSPQAQPLIEAGKNSTNPATRSFFREMWEGAASFKDSKAGIYTKTQRLLNMPSFSNMVTGESTINLKDAIDSNNLILFNLAVGNLGDQAPLFIGKIIISLLQSISFQRAGIEKKDRKPVYLYIDEFQDFVSPSMIRILTQGRKYKMFLTIANQFVGQGMTSEEQDAIFGTTKIKIIGANSYKSHNTLSKETDAELALLKKLQVGQFMVKVGDGEPFVLHASKKSLDDKNSMEPAEFESFISEQKIKHYRKKPIDTILKDMIEREKNPAEVRINQPPTDESVKQTIPTVAPEDKTDLAPKFAEDVETKHHERQA